MPSNGLGPWMPFYVNDFLSSNHVAEMTTEEIGAYALLLLRQWASSDQSLPNDPVALAKLARMPDGWGSQPEYQDSYGRVLICFQKVNGKIYNKRLRKLANETKKFKKKKSDAGKLGAKVKAQKRLDGASTA